jgi:GWxTD domain-containing protein
MMYNLFITLTLLISLPVSAAIQTTGYPENDMDTLFLKGIELQEAGYYNDAASAWIEYADSGVNPDFRVSHNLISLVTEHGLTTHYEDACRIYLWGLEMESITDEVKELLHNELMHIESMLGQRETRQLRRMIDSGDTNIFRFLMDFWEERTLTPSDSYNARLLEHWERVNYARKNFNTSSNQEYDARGGIYIRFGPPQASRSGVFMYNPGFVNYIVATRMDDGRGYGSAEENAVNTTMYLNTIYQVRNYHQYPSFEVWVYRDLTSGPDNAIYIFGNNSGGSVMSLKQSVDDFVPSAAYSMSSRNNPMSMSMVEAAGIGEPSGGSGSFDSENRGGDTDVILDAGGAGMGKSEAISPALVLQFMYYRQLASLDVYFSSRYDEMLDRFMNTSVRLSRSAAREFQQMNSARMLIAKRDVPAERSSNSNKLFDISPSVYTYRFLDEEFNPYLKLYVQEETEEAIVFEELKKRNNVDDIRYHNYELVRTVRMNGASMDDPGSKTYRANVAHHQPDPLENNMIRIPYSGESGSLTFFSELYDIENGAEAEISGSSTLRSNLRGVGRTSVEYGEKVPSEDLFTSDVIVGYPDGQNNFILAHNRVIPEGSAIQFYYEAYNLPQDESGLYSFNLTYKLTRKRSTVGRIIRFGRESYTSMSIENTTDEPRFSQLLEIVSDQLRSGTYELELRFTANGAEETLHSTTLTLNVE